MLLVRQFKCRRGASGCNVQPDRNSELNGIDPEAYLSCCSISAEITDLVNQFFAPREWTVYGIRFELIGRDISPDFPESGILGVVSLRVRRLVSA